MDFKITVLSACIACVNAQGQIVLDGSLGQRGALQGPDYTVDVSFGKQAGQNIFHSFSRFDLNRNESVTFTGPSDTLNIINRITGGNPSMINGTIRSSLPNGFVFLLNPQGIVFGPHARLDLQSGFVATSAEKIYFGEGTSFSVDPQEHSTFSSAEPTAFGFISHAPAPIILQGSRFSLPDNQLLLLLGGDVKLRGGSEISTPQGPGDNKETLPYISGTALVSVASAGKVILPTTEVNIDKENGLFRFEGIERFGTIKLDRNSRIKAEGKGEGAGIIYIQGGQFEVDDSQISTDTTGDDVSGLIAIRAEDITLRNSEIRSNLLTGHGMGGSILIVAQESLNLFNYSHIVADTYGEGNAGSIFLFANRLNLQDAALSTNTFSQGQGGNIIIEATDSIVSSANQPDTCFEACNTIEADSHSTGHAGFISMTAQRARFTDKTILSSSTFSTGQGGTLQLTIQDTLTLTNSAIGSISGSQALTAGKAGNIIISANTLNIGERGAITTDTHNAAGGDIDIQVAQLLYLHEGAISTSVFSGIDNGGNITIHHPQFVVLNNGLLFANADQGRGGNITLLAQQFIPSAESKIDASSEKGISGQIVISSPINDINNSLATLPIGFLNAPELLVEPCFKQLATGRKTNRFLVHRLWGSPILPEDLHRSQLTPPKRIPKKATSLKKKKQPTYRRSLFSH